MKVYIVNCNFVVFGVFLQPTDAERSAENTMQALSAVTWRPVGHWKWSGDAAPLTTRFFVEIEQHEVK